MALLPVFVVDMNTLLERVRMTVATAPPGVVAQALEETRLFLYSASSGLGGTLVASILTQPYVENATTEAQLKRTCANVLEVLVMRRQLLHTMPVLFMDSNKSEEAWNEDGFFRGSFADVSEMLEDLNFHISDKLLELTSSLEPSGAGSLKAATISPTCAPALPGDSVRGVYYA